MRPGDDAFQILRTVSGELTALPRATAQMTWKTARLVAAFPDLISSREPTAWLQTANPGFNGRTPRELVEAGELRSPLGDGPPNTGWGLCLGKKIPAALGNRA